MPEIMPVSFKFWPSWRDTFPILHSTSRILLFLFMIFLIQFFKWFNKVNFRNNHNEFHSFTCFYYNKSRGLRQICVSQLLIIISFFQSTASTFWVVNYKNKMLEFICKVMRPQCHGSMLQWFSCHNRAFRELSKWRQQWQQPFHKSVIWLIEWGKILVLHVRQAFWCNFLK